VLRLLSAGDTAFRLGQANAEPQVLAGGSADILRGVQPTLEAADLRVIQWETVLTEGGQSIIKSGPPLRSPPGCAAFARAGGFDVALLANNHIGDLGPAAALETAEHLRRQGLTVVGVGKDLQDAQRFIRLERAGLSVAILNAAENEFGLATTRRAGGNPLNLPANLRALRQARQQADLAVVFLHGGTEFLPMPHPRLMETCRALADAGAAAIVCIHAHAPQGIEVYDGVPIVYSPGNLFFPHTAAPDSWWWLGYLTTLTLDRRGATAIEVAPYRFDGTPWRIRPLQDAARQAFLQHFDRLCRLASSYEESVRLFEAWAADLGCRILKDLCEGGVPWPKDLHNREQLLAAMPLRNYLTCEAHHEMLRTAIVLVEEGRVEEALKHRAELESLRSAAFLRPDPATVA
jgi:poly-gamma-glutamate synthesis protein (capsule biosynthesis protein)